MDWSQTERVRALAFALAAASLASPAPAQTQLATVTDCLDGKPADIAAQRDAELDGFEKRAWIAQGRLRAAIRLSDRQRMHEEDRTFDATIEEYPYGTPGGHAVETAEQLVAVEVNEDRVDGKQYLYTLTEATLYREDISDPANPTDLVWMPLIDTCLPPAQPCNDPEHFQPWEEMRDIKIWNHPTIANRGKVILLTSKRIVVIRDKDFDLSYKSSATELFDEGEGGWFKNTTDTHFNDTKVFQFWNLRIADDGGSSGAKAFVTAEQGSRAVSGTRGAQLIMACDLDTDDLSQNPTFDNGTGQGTLAVTYWDPFVHAIPTPVPPAGAGNLWNALHTVNSLDAIWDPAAQVASVYAACGSGSQVQRFDATNWFATGGLAPTYRLDVQPAAIDPLVNLLADPDTPGRFFVMHELASTVAVEDLQNPGTLTVLRNTVAEPNAKKGSTHDLAYVQNLAMGVDSSVWTTGDGRVDHTQKVLDFSPDLDLVQGTVDLVDEYPGLSSSDGGVYVEFAGGGGEIYLPTFGGVMRYTYDALDGEWESVPESFQPAEWGLNSGIALNTEHVDYGFHEGAHRIYTVPGNGGFMEFEVGLDRNLRPNVYVTPADLAMPPSLVSMINGNPVTWYSSWVDPSTQVPWPSAEYYANDLAFLDTGSDHYVLTILTDHNMIEPDSSGGFGQNAVRHTQHALLAFKWNVLSSSWDHVASEVAAPIAYAGSTLAAQNAKSARLAQTVALAPGLDANDWFAFVGHRDGVFSVKLDAAAGTLTLASDFLLSDDCGGLVANEDRLFVWVDLYPPELRIYEWDRTTGIISPGDLSGTGEPLGENQYVMNGTGGLIPGETGRCFRMRFHREPGGSNGSGHLLAACEPELFKLAWPGPGGGGELPEDTVGVADVWTPENYYDAIQDCRVYDMSAVYGPTDSTKILAVKNSEAFAVVEFQ